VLLYILFYRKTEAANVHEEHKNLHTQLLKGNKELKKTQITLVQ